MACMKRAMFSILGVTLTFSYHRDCTLIVEVDLAAHAVGASAADVPDRSGDADSFGSVSPEDVEVDED